jgi:diadenosine tetraphosphate (Ap4A) HIT family hydrolase
MARPGWPDDFDALKAGDGCEICAQYRGVDDNPYGPLVFAGEHSDAFLQRRGFGPGYTVVVHRGDRHISDPTDLSPGDAAGYWREVMLVALAIEATYSPLKMNLMMLGNQLPHLHTHVVPRYRDDHDAGGPPEFDESAPARNEGTMQNEADALRHAIEQGNDFD